MVSTVEAKNGVATAGELIYFNIETTGKVVVSPQNNDQTTFEFELLTLRRISTESPEDYIALTPAIPFDNANNYQILTAGNYALRTVNEVDIIVAVEQ